MGRIFACVLFSAAALIASGQSNAVNLAAIAFEKGHFDNAWENANSALQAPEKLDNLLLHQAYGIRGKAGARIAYNALTKMEDENTEKYAGMALQAFNDFKIILDSKDSAMIRDVTKEFYKLGHALLLSGTDYDAINADKETPDSTLIDKSIECYSATIELWKLAGREKYKPYYYRGDALLAKKEYDKAVADLDKAMSMFIAAARRQPDMGIGDLGYRLAYTQAGVFGNNEAALKTIDKALELLDAELLLAESKKEKSAEQYEIIKNEYDVLTGELNSLKSSVAEAKPGILPAHKPVRN